MNLPGALREDWDLERLAGLGKSVSGHGVVVVGMSWHAGSGLRGEGQPRSQEEGITCLRSGSLQKVTG